MTSAGLTPAELASPAEKQAKERLPRPPHWRRFVALYGLLGAAFLVAAAGAVIYGTRSISPAPAWSLWQPSGGGLGAARQIAQHVAPAYRLPSGLQLVDVVAKTPSVENGKQTLPLHYIDIRGTGGAGDSVTPIKASDSVMFSLCGLGSTCAIANGTPSLARARLVRREILELALYTFRYAHGIKNVIAFVPPPKGQPSREIVYLRKDDLQTQLKQPLARALRPKTPLPNSIPAREVELVDSITASRVYAFKIAQAPLGDLVLVLAPSSA